MKKIYYVSLQAKRIMESKCDATYEFEVEALPEELEQLQKIFTNMENADHTSFWSSHLPFIPYHKDPENDTYDQHLKDAYKLIYQLGTQDTKNHISSMNMIN